jgi:hypothetical protein
MRNGAGEGQRTRKAFQVLALVCGGFLGSGYCVGSAAHAPVVAICEARNSGQFECYDTAFESPEYVDCTDQVNAPPIGSTTERGGGVIVWGNTIDGKFVANGRAVYEWSGAQAQAGGVVYALIGVDEDRVFADGADRACRAGWFTP